jgi:hypothetical protein
MKDVGRDNPDISRAQFMHLPVSGGYPGSPFLDEHNLLSFMVVTGDLTSPLNGNLAYHDAVG